MAMKFKEFSLKALLPFIIIALVSLVAAILFGWLAVSIGFIAYVILSLLYK
jgi:CDP-diacylglycerol--serine O-phosphatidyltransferase